MSVLLWTLYNKHVSCLMLSFPEQFVFPAYYKQQNHKEPPALHIWCKQCPCLKKKSPTTAAMQLCAHDANISIFNSIYHRENMCLVCDFKNSKNNELSNISKQSWNARSTQRCETKRQFEVMVQGS